MHSVYCSAEIIRAARDRANELTKVPPKGTGNTVHFQRLFQKRFAHTRRRKCNVSLMCLHYAAVYRYLDTRVKAFYEMKRWKEMPLRNCRA